MQTFQFVQKNRKLLDQMRDAIRLRNYSYRAEQSYVQWAKRNILLDNLSRGV